MPSFHFRSGDGKLVPCRGGDGRVLEHCARHGGSDVTAPDVEAAYAMIDSRGPGWGGMRSVTALGSLSPFLPEVRMRLPAIGGAAAVVCGLLSAGADGGPAAGRG